jgi:hypothetical protein
MNTRSPIPVLRPVTFTTEPIAFIEVNEFSVVEAEFISIFSVMTIEAPPHCLGMMKLDL